MPEPIETIENLLTELNIPFQRVDHAPLFSTKDEGPEMPGAHTKQLLMRDKKSGRYILAIVMHDKKVDTKALAKEVGVKELSFASAEELQELLRVTPGSVTPFGLIYDTEKKIEVLFDKDAWAIGKFRFHPLINTATLLIDRDSITKFFTHTGHTPVVQKIASK